MAVAAVKSSTSLDLFHINLAKDCLQSLPVEDSCGGGHAADAELRGEDDGTSPAEAAPRRRSLNAFSSSLKDFEQGPIIGKLCTVFAESLFVSPSWLIPSQSQWI